MSFAGHVMDMIARMKANDRHRKYKAFDRDAGPTPQAVRSEYLVPPTEEQIAEVRAIMIRERTKETRRTVIIGSMAMLIFGWFLWWLFA